MKSRKYIALQVLFILAAYAIGYSQQLKNVEETKLAAKEVLKAAEGVQIENQLIKSTLVDYRLSCNKSERF